MEAEEYQDLDPAFAERDRTRKAGLPVIIAETERLLIREITMEDVPRLYEIFHMPGIENIVHPSQSLDEELEFMKAYISHAYAFYDFGLWSVLEKKSGEIIGEAGLFPSERADDAVEMGYVIAPFFHGKGYAAECGRAILRYAFDVLDLEEIHLFADRFNLASICTARTLGFIQTQGTGCGSGPQKEDMIHMTAGPETVRTGENP